MLSVSGEDGLSRDEVIARAMLRLKEIARILGRPVSDFFDPPEAEVPPPMDDGSASSGNGEG